MKNIIIYQTNAGLSYKQLAYLIKIDDNHNDYLCIGLNNIDYSDDYVIGDLTTLCENEVEISNFKLEDSPLYNEKLFNFMVNIIKRNLQNNNK